MAIAPSIRLNFVRAVRSPQWTAVAFAAAVIALLAVAWFAYRPGLSGAFLFDDLGTLPKLGATGPVDNWPTFWRYITSGTADPTGRPLALLSFLIDGRNWPTNPYPFKLTNVILHLINGVLLAWVLLNLGKVLRSSQTATASGRTLWRNAQGTKRAPVVAWDSCGVAVAALFGAGAWLLHPLLVSTTLYVVQREAMLPTTFALIGMLGWMASRKALARWHLKRAYTGMALSAWLCTGLAVSSKANGALLPILLLLTEWIVLSREPMPSPFIEQRRRYAVTVILIVPSLLVVAYLLSMLPGVIRTAPGIRGWTVGQRLLTEPRVIADYLWLLFAPRAYSTGLFNDQFVASTGWLHPASTLPCVILILALIGLGFALRKRHPAISLALLFYFAAQLMESGWIPLELYFEHRNYLPAMLLFWPIGIALGSVGSLRLLRTLVAAAVLGGLAILTAQRAALWGDAFHQAQIWAAFNPDSARAQTSAALYDLQAGRTHLAIARLRPALKKHPDSVQIAANLVTAECKLGSVKPGALAAVNTALGHDLVGGEVAFNWFVQTLPLASRHACTGLTLADMQDLLAASGSNPHWRNRQGTRVNVYHLQGLLELSEHRPNQALAEFNRTLAQTRNPATALSQAATLGAAGYPELGLRHLNYLASLPPPRTPGLGMPRIHAWVLREQGWWPKEIADLRTALEQAAAAKAGSEAGKLGRRADQAG